MSRIVTFICAIYVSVLVTPIKLAVINPLREAIISCTNRKITLPRARHRMLECVYNHRGFVNYLLEFQVKFISSNKAKALRSLYMPRLKRNMSHAAVRSPRGGEVMDCPNSI
jgi:hypothetical protein